MFDNIYISTSINMDPYQNTIQEQDMYHENCLMMIQLAQNTQKNKQTLIQ
jgi:hypothetical protein